MVHFILTVILILLKEVMRYHLITLITVVEKVQILVESREITLKTINPGLTLPLQGQGQIHARKRCHDQEVLQMVVLATQHLQHHLILTHNIATEAQ